MPLSFCCLLYQSAAAGAVIADQQKIAEAFLNVIPKKLDGSEATLLAK